MDDNILDFVLDEGMFKDPLSLIDPFANYEEILKIKSIGDAFRMLCPGLIGWLETKNAAPLTCIMTSSNFFLEFLPSKTRDKYLRKRDLTVEEKSSMSQEQNRDNARRTRIRKKIYDLFLSRAIEDLEKKLDKLDPKILTSLNLDDKMFPSHARSMYRVSRSSLSSSAHDMKHKNDLAPSELRLKRIRQFIIMRVSSSPQREAWALLCTPGIIHSMAKPVYRSTSSLGFFDQCNYICAGVEALIDDTEHRVNFIKSVRNIIIYLL